MILALETATAACSVAVAAPGTGVVAEITAPAGPAHTQRLLSDVHHALGMAGIAAGDLRTVVVGLGPGTFTGLRIGVATARALAQSTGARLVGVPTLAALALALAEGDAAAKATALVALIDGKRKEVFAACYRRGASYAVHCAADESGPALELLRGPAVVAAAELQSFLTPWPTAIVGGDGAHLYSAELPAGAHLARGVHAPTATMVLRAWQCWVPGIVEGVDQVLPIYGRAPDAQRWTQPAAGSAS